MVLWQIIPFLATLRIRPDVQQSLSNKYYRQPAGFGIEAEHNRTVALWQCGTVTPPLDVNETLISFGDFAGNCCRQLSWQLVPIELQWRQSLALFNCS